MSPLWYNPSLCAGKLAEARQRLEVERAAEALAKEARTAKTVEQLPRLEAVILAAKKVGAEHLDQESYNLASELRESLARAFRVRHPSRIIVSCLLFTRGGFMRDPPLRHVPHGSRLS